MAKDEGHSKHDTALVSAPNMIANFVFLFEAQVHVETEKLVIMSASGLHGVTEIISRFS